MDLGLRGKRLQSLLIEYSIRMQLSDVYFALIASPFTLDRHGKVFTISPEDDPDEAFEPIRQLVGQQVEDARATPSGGLEMVFEDGSRLQVAPDEAHEAWNVSGPDGALVVSMPGGELAIWSPQTDPDQT